MPKLRPVTFKHYTLQLFEVIERHTLLSSLYLRQFFPNISESNLLHHLEELADGAYLVRPASLNPRHVFNDYKVYGIGDRAKETLGFRHATPVSGDNRHKLMAGSITASIELGLPKEWKYIGQEEILAGRFCKQKTIALESSIPGSSRPIVPDQLFGIEYSEDNARFFALEADRGTEPITRKDMKQNSIEKKVKQYASVMLTGSFKKLGIPNLFPMFVTTEDDEHQRVKKHRADYIVDEFTKLGRLHNFFLAKSVTGFHPYLRTPKLMPHVWTDPYQRAGSPFWLTKPEMQPII